MPDAMLFPVPSHRRDPWQDRPEACIEYHLRTDAEADVLCRLLGLFAQLQLLPESLQVHRHNHDLHVHLQLHGLSHHRAAVLAEKLRGLVCVWQVEWQHLDHSQMTAIASVG